MPDGSINPASTADKLEAFGLDAMLNCWSPLVHATKVGAPLHTEWTQECSQSVHSSSQPAPFAASPSCSAGASLSVAAPSDRCPAITIFPPPALWLSPVVVSVVGPPPLNKCALQGERLHALHTEDAQIVHAANIDYPPTRWP